LTENDIGKPRAATVLEKLSELNDHVTVKIHTGEITESTITKFQVF
jgi:molybdopterin/thiamine biosynthesis adenylyltransferase